MLGWFNCWFFDYLVLLICLFIFVKYKMLFVLFYEENIKYYSNLFIFWIFWSKYMYDIYFYGINCYIKYFLYNSMYNVYR